MKERAAEQWQLDQGKPLVGKRLPHSQGWLVYRAVEQLPDPHRDVVEMRAWGRMTFQAIADELGMPGRNYAGMYYTRALKKIRDYMEEHGETAE